MFFGLSDLVIWFLGFSALCWLLAQVREQASGFLKYFNKIFYDPMMWIADHLSQWLKRAWSWLGGQLNNSSVDRGKTLSSRLVGGLVATTCCAVFTTNDLFLLSGILVGMGIGEANIAFPIDKSLLSAASLICSGLIAGILMTDSIGITSLGPFSRIKNRFVRAGAGLGSALLLLGCVLIVCHLADWRVAALYESMNAEVPSQEIDLNALLAGGGDAQASLESAANSNANSAMALAMHHQGMALKGIATLSIVCTAISFIMAGELAGLIFLGLIAGVLLIPSLVMSLVSLTLLGINAVYNFIDSALDLCLGWGTRIDSWLIKAWNMIKAATRRANRSEPSSDTRNPAIQDGPVVDFDSPGANPSQSGKTVVDLSKTDPWLILIRKTTAKPPVPVPVPKTAAPRPRRVLIPIA